jgi:hypothetical protein
LKSFRCIKEEEEELRILKFSDPYDFFGLAFWSPLPKGTKKFVCGPAFGASLFKLWGLAFFWGGGFAFGGLELFGARAAWIPR